MYMVLDQTFHGAFHDLSLFKLVGMTQFIDKVMKRKSHAAYKVYKAVPAFENLHKWLRKKSFKPSSMIFSII